ncbi:hypothetical protein BaRGS_00038306 [Batillaria attramentaria]|uniref:RING-type domain-containing protein n=1 Tax=Batillaria attramentaria TaxID=370345 RepID=A0ABD0J6G8_9CAEN
MRRRRGRPGGGMQVLMRAPGQGAVGLARAGGGEGGAGMRLLMGGLRRRGQRPTDSPDDDGANLPQGEFDPDERLLAGGHPEDFLSIMHDPSLMLLMLLLRAPDTLNEGGVDLEDYEGLWELAERLGEVRRRGITEEEINQLPTHKFKSESAKVEFGAAAAEANAVQCQICLVDFEVGDSLRSIPCKHDFHKGCIDEWLKRNATCPICRQEIKPS